MKTSCALAIAALALAPIVGGMAGDWPYPCRTLGLCATANAQATDQAKPGYTDDLTVEQALNVYGGLTQLSSYDSVDKDGKPAKVFYKFGPDLRILIAVNIDVGRAVETRIKNEQNRIVMELSENAGKVPEDKMGAYNIEISKMMQAKSRAGYYRIKAADLKLDDNQIPASVLSLIIPILDR